jgi:hypothetical protein
VEVLNHALLGLNPLSFNQEGRVDKIKLLSTPEKAIAGGGVLMFIASFFDWWSVSEGPFSFGGSGWDAPGSIWSVLAILISVALAAVIIATKLGNVQMPALPENVSWSQIYGGGAAAVVVLMLLKAWRILALPSGYGFGIGFFLGVIAAAAIAYGGYMMYKQEKAQGG